MFDDKVALFAVVFIVYVVINAMRLNWLKERVEDLEKEVFVNKKVEKLEKDS